MLPLNVQRFECASTSGNDRTSATNFASTVEDTDWGAIEAQAGLPRQSMEELAGLIRDAKTAVLVWSMGITQHAFGAPASADDPQRRFARGFVGRDRCG